MWVFICSRAEERHSMISRDDESLYDEYDVGQGGNGAEAGQLLQPEYNEPINDEYDVDQGDNGAGAGQLLQPEHNEPIQFLEVESTADRNASLVNMASANKDPLDNEIAGHSAQRESEISIEWLEVESVSDGGALDSLNSCDREAAESLQIEYVVDAGEDVSIKTENFNMARMRSSLDSTNTSDCVIVAEYRECEEEVDDTSAE